MIKIIAYASSTRPNHLWSAAQFNNALPKNRLAADIPLVALADVPAISGAPLDWVRIAKAAAAHGVSFPTNERLEAFLSDISA